MDEKIFEENKKYRRAGPHWIEWNEKKESWEIADDISDAEIEGLETVGQHATWFSDIITKVYEEAMKHGYKHGYEKGYEDAINEISDKDEEEAE